MGNFQFSMPQEPRVAWEIEAQLKFERLSFGNFDQH